ncbi:MAG: amidohydrolase family protein, partial [Phycisphaerales bacterium]|nr:amidohydrolase family protein [Phycisphaerales bacterium]
MTKADVILRGGQIVDVSTRTLIRQDVGITDGLITFDAADANEIIEIDGAYIAPGLIDAHMHVESTMLPPSGFCNLAVPRGTTTVVLDPHEIANVLGIAGIKLIMDDAKNLPID